jgi:catechol 2,3-dioxygenase-like lactoylglutathione lyase family enzyme
MSPPNILGLDHVVLRVTDLDRARDFYCDILGCGVEVFQKKIGLLQLRAGDSLIDLVPVNGQLGRMGGAAPGAEGRNMDHFCLKVKPFETGAIMAHLRAHGVDPGTVEQRYGAEGMGPSIYLRDPDGNVVELKGPATSKEPPAGT